jgi:hypothetical protein
MADYDIDVNARLSRLETIIESVSITLDKIQSKLDSHSKINWAPIAIGVTIFFTVAGSVSTIYNARIATLNTGVEAIATRVVVLEKNDVERGVTVKVTEERIKEIEKDVEELRREHHDER